MSESKGIRSKSNLDHVNSKLHRLKLDDTKTDQSSIHPVPGPLQPNQKLANPKSRISPPPPQVKELLSRIQAQESELVQLRKVKDKCLHVEELLWESRQVCRQLQADNSSLKKQLSTLKRNIKSGEVFKNANTKHFCMTNSDASAKNTVVNSSESSIGITFVPPLCSTFKSVQSLSVEYGSSKEKDLTPDTKLQSLASTVQENISPDLFSYQEETEDEDIHSIKLNRTQNLTQSLEKIVWESPKLSGCQGWKNREGENIFVLTKMETKWRKTSRTHHLVAKVKGEIKTKDEGTIYLVDFYKRASLHGSKFLMDESETDLVVEKKDIVCLLPEPKHRRRGYVEFQFDFEDYDMYF